MFLNRIFNKRKIVQISLHLTFKGGNVSIPEVLKTGLEKIRAHSTTWQLKAIKLVQRPIKKPISDAEH